MLSKENSYVDKTINVVNYLDDVINNSYLEALAMD